MDHIKVLEAKKTLDKLLGKQRVALYKPIQIAEILYRVRRGKLSINDAFLVQFVRDKKIKRSIDKAYEIVVYALFNTLVKHLRAKITLSTDPSQIDLPRAFEEFAHLVLGIDAQTPSISIEARLYRAGATNAADRGLDMWANFGPVIQVKHITLTDELAEDICDEVAADRIVIVCKDSERRTIEYVLQQLGHRVQAIIVQSQLVHWYEQALHGEFGNRLGEDLLNNLRQEFRIEFPYSTTFESFYREREYDRVPKSLSQFWQSD